MKVFLDLEGTVIEQWQQFPTFLPTHCEHIRQFLKNDRVNDISITRFLRADEDATVSVFSFAIHTDEERDQFFDTIAGDMERILDCRIDEVVTVPMMQAASEAINKVRYFDVSDFIQMRGKDMAFHDWCHKHRQGQLSVLIDDVVPNRISVDTDDHATVLTVNVNNLPI